SDGAHLFAQSLELSCHLQRACIKFLAGWSRVDPFRGPLEQTGADALLQLLDLHAEARLGRVNTFRGRRTGTLLVSGVESPDFLEWHRSPPETCPGAPCPRNQHTLPPESRPGCTAARLASRRAGIRSHKASPGTRSARLIPAIRPFGFAPASQGLVSVCLPAKSTGPFGSRATKGRTWTPGDLHDHSQF